MIDNLLLRIATARSFLAKLWAIARPYWFAAELQQVRIWRLSLSMKEAWIGRSVLTLIIALNVFIVYLMKLLNDWNGRFYDALQERDAAAFRYELGYWFVLVAILIVVSVYSQWFQQLLTIRWRRWLTEVYFRDWLANRTYYRMELVGDGTDNPEQRIEQDCAAFADQTLDNLIDLLSQVITLVTFTAILWNLSGSFVLPFFGGIEIPGYMLWAALLYALIGSWLTYWIGRPLVRINFNLQRYNADFRFRMTRIRENAESIALYRGEPDEEHGLRSAFARIYATWWMLMTYSKRLNWLNFFYGQFASVFPFVVQSPRYFSGEVQLGALMQTASAFGQVQGALSWFVDKYPDIAEWMAVVDRLTSFGDAMTRAKLAAESETGIELVPGPADRLVMEDVHIRLPNGALLIDKLDLAVRRGEAVMLTGPSGSGKTTLFRALGGLWPFGRGRIHLPEGARVLFLPQKPYLPIGTLKQVLSYPERADRYDDATCREALEAVALAHLAGRLEETDNWSLALSVGEQQRLAFARALLYRPDWIFIDEGTSALDAGLAHRMYTLLTHRLQGSTIFSIAHDLTVAEFHQRHLAFDPERHTIEERGAAEKLATA